VRRWLAGRSTLPAETQRYVEAITGRAAAEWAAASPDNAAPDKGRPPVKFTCEAMTAMLRQTPTVFITKLEQHVAGSTGSPWGVQVSAGFSREHALAAYSAIEQRERETLAGFDPVILQTLLRSRGTKPFYQVRIGTATRESANTLCARLKKRGTACMVLRNSGQRSG
jgi:hypothetical protein